MTRLLCVLPIFLQIVHAFENTSPLLTWSSKRSNAIDSLPSSAVQASTILDSLLSTQDICNYDAVVLVQQRGLHASDLRNLSPQTSRLPQHLSDSPSSRSFQYLVNTDGSASLPSRALDIAKECESRFVNPGAEFDTSMKHVFSINLPALSETGTARREAMSEHERDFEQQYSQISTAFPNHLVVYSGVPLSTFSARASARVARADDDLVKGGILKRYQILTPGLITVFLVVFFILIPVLMLGIKALAGIQNPIKMDMPKNFNAAERKNQ